MRLNIQNMSMQCGSGKRKRKASALRDGECKGELRISDPARCCQDTGACSVATLGSKTKHRCSEGKVNAVILLLFRHCEEQTQLELSLSEAEFQRQQV